MARSIPSYPDPQNSAQPIQGAYGYTSGIGLDLRNGAGSAVMDIHRTPASAAALDQPVNQLRISFGEVFSPGDPSTSPPTPAVQAATIAEFLSDPQVAAAWAVIEAALDAQWAKHPALAGSSEAT